MANKCYALVIGAHPDDPEFGIAGTVAAWTAKGKKVVYAICTNGNKGSDDPGITPQKLASIRKREESAAARVLGVEEVVFLGHNDQELEDTADFRKELVKIIRTYRPWLVAAPDPYRRYIWHRDHRIAGQVALDAVFPYARDRMAYPDLIKAGYQPHKVWEMLFWGADDPNYFVDITRTYAVKLKALRCHKSQVGQFGKGLEDWLRDMHKRHAKKHKYDLAESFYRVKLEY